MSLKVLELNDSAVTVSDHSGIITQSPGFALLAPGGLEVGEAAEKQARLNPTGSFNKFWSQLSLEPLGHSSGKARHFADLAYAHLMHVAEAGQLQDEVILAVPGNFTNQQLAILLGLVGSCPFQPLGIVDSALAGALDISDGRPLVYADIQLHQVLLTRFVTVDGHLQREKVAQIPEIGLQNFSNLIMQLATGLFIQQCRFNPQHDAHSEQQMYNQLPNWLQKSRGNRSSLLMEIKTGDGVHEAKLPWESLVQKLNEYYSRINQQLSALMGGEPVQLAVSSALAELPDFTQSLSVDAEPIIVTQDRIGRNCLAMAAQIDSRDSGFRCISRLPLAGAVTASPDESRNEAGGFENATADKAAPTHALYGDQAIPLGHIRLKNTPEGQLGRVNGSGIVMALKDLPAQLGEINLEDGQVYLDSPVSETLVNGEVISGRHPLQLGDRISYGAPDHEIQLIRVSDGKQ